MTKCKICNSSSDTIFEAQVLFKYDVKYFQCSNCKFIQTEEPYWLEEAYSSAITDLDLGYVTRNILFSELTRKTINHAFAKKSSFLDYGGGYGMFVRLMRDKGFDFYREDKYCENLFSNHFDIDDLKVKKKFELLTSFEVFEHLVNPLDEIEKMMQFSDNLLFSTELQPDKKFASAKDWWYFSPEIGQHVALFSKNALLEVAKKYNFKFYTSKYNVHLLTRKKFRINPLTYPSYSNLIKDKLLKRNFSNPRSLLMKDYEAVKQILTDKK